MRKVFIPITSVISLIAWVYAVLERFGEKDWLILAVDVVIPPIGVIDGIGKFIGAW